MADWTDRVVIVVEMGRVNAANAIYKNIDLGGHGDETFPNVLLSSDGNEPATHTATESLATATMRQGIQQALGSVLFTDVVDVIGVGHIDEVAAGLGLQRVVTAEI
jgi:hypothetical protein